MKRFIYYALVLCTSTAIGTSCKMEEADIFPESSATRLNKARSEYLVALSKPSNGWVMEYFATPESEGYSLLMKFDTTELVNVAARSKYTSDVYKEEKSYFRLIADNGPMLTFDTYNTLLHSYSNPINPDGTGLGGDYEFVVMKMDTDRVVLKGKKRGTEINLRKIAQAKDWVQYMAQVDSVNTAIFGGSINNLYLIMGKDSFLVSNGNSGIFKITRPNEDPLVNGTSKPYIITPRGLRLYSEFVDNGNSVMNFKLSPDNQRLECTDSKVAAYLVGPDPLVYFMSNSSSWAFVFNTSMGAGFKAIYDKIVTSCKTKLKENFTDLWLRTYSTSTTTYYSLSFKSGKYTGNFKFSRQQTSDGKVFFNYEGVADTNGSYYLKNIAGFDELIKYMNQNFTVSADCGLNMSKLRFTSGSTSELGFYLTK